MESQSIDFIENLEQLSSYAWAYAALATALEIGMLDRLAEPISEPALAQACGVEEGLASDLVEALVALGAVRRDGPTLRPAPSFEMLLSPTVAKVIRAGVRGDHLQTRSLLRRAREGEELTGWSLEDPVALTAQGETGSMTGLWIEALLPGLEGLGERMSRPGARALDVGAGVGVVSTELSRLWPRAEVVGLEPHRTAREIGTSRIAAEGLADRVALRDERLERLGERAAYDLAFLPQPFLSPEAVSAGLPRVLRALRPGGWLIVLTHDLDSTSSLVDAARRFRARIWGGGAITAERIGAELQQLGFATAASNHKIGSFRAVCARRPAPSDGPGDDLIAASGEVPAYE